MSPRRPIRTRRLLLQAARALPHRLVRPELVGRIVWVLPAPPAPARAHGPGNGHGRLAARTYRVVIDVDGTVHLPGRVAYPFTLELLAGRILVEIAASAQSKRARATLLEVNGEAV